MIKDLVGKKVLATTSSFFYAPDGVLYRAVWGTLKNVTEAKEAFGFVPNRAHANWMIEIGNMVVMGCQILYVVDCPIKPDHEKVKTVMYDSNGIKEFERPNEIYLSE